MKRIDRNILTIASVGLLVCGAWSCTDLDVPVESEYTSSNFPSTTEEYIAASGPAYTQLRGSFCTAYWFMQELSTDEAILPARGGNWYDGGKYRDLHLHTWTKDLEFVGTSWSWLYGGVSSCNRIIKLFSTKADNDAKTQITAEVKTMRAFYYFLLMDLYGNVPIVQEFGDTSNVAKSPRIDVFNFIESEIKAALPSLSTKTGTATYGRPTKWMAWAMLAKLYLNAEYYTGTAKYNDAVAACDTIITEAQTNSTFGLDADYISEFYPTNGPSFKDFIFAIPFDGSKATGQFYARYYLHPYLQAKYGIPFRPSNAVSTIPEFYALFNDLSDKRNQIWLTGKQYDFNGNAITVTTTKSGVDATYTGSDAKNEVVYQLEFTPNITLDPSKPTSSFDVGSDELGKAKGYRCIKFYPDASSTDRNQSNDVPVFRYADILLEKAEAILRGATATKGQTALSLVNMVRDRVGASDFESVTLQDILNERGREFVYECWRRNDLIRFGAFENSWGFKTNAETYRRIFPVPASELLLNSALKQNDGY